MEVRGCKLQVAAGEGAVAHIRGVIYCENIGVLRLGCGMLGETRAELAAASSLRMTIE